MHYLSRYPICFLQIVSTLLLCSCTTNVTGLKRPTYEQAIMTALQYQAQTKSQYQPQYQPAPVVVPQPPVITVTSPQTERGPKVVAKGSTITVTGTVTGGNGIADVSVNGKPANLDEQGNFSASDILLKVGENQITIDALGVNNQHATKSITVARKGGRVTKSSASGTRTDRSLARVSKTTASAKNRDSRKRIALVVGNSKYRSSPLKNPANDAHVMAATLRRLGFEVEEKTDLGFMAMNTAVEKFGKRLTSGGIGLFYYAGHGMQVGGANYLIPIDANIEDENEVRFKAVDAGLVLAKMDQAKSNINIVVLDACRDNPFSRSFRSSAHGLASMDAPNGTFIAYATAPGKTAADGTGKNGLYTQELVKVLETPGLKLEDVFKRTLKGVREKSGNRQTPWVASNLEGDFWFVMPSGMTEFQPPKDEPVPVSLPEAVQSEQESKNASVEPVPPQPMFPPQGTQISVNGQGEACIKLAAALKACDYAGGFLTLGCKAVARSQFNCPGL